VVLVVTVGVVVVVMASTVPIHIVCVLSNITAGLVHRVGLCEWDILVGCSLMGAVIVVFMLRASP